jgi:hypothetical protein
MQYTRRKNKRKHNKKHSTTVRSGGSFGNMRQNMMSGLQSGMQYANRGAQYASQGVQSGLQYANRGLNNYVVQPVASTFNQFTQPFRSNMNTLRVPSSDAIDSSPENTWRTSSTSTAEDDRFKTAANKIMSANRIMNKFPARPISSQQPSSDALVYPESEPQDALIYPESEPSDAVIHPESVELSMPDPLTNAYQTAQQAPVALYNTASTVGSTLAQAPGALYNAVGTVGSTLAQAPGALYNAASTGIVNQPTKTYIVRYTKMSTGQITDKEVFIQGVNSYKHYIIDKKGIPQYCLDEIPFNMFGDHMNKPFDIRNYTTCGVSFAPLGHIK